MDGIIDTVSAHHPLMPLIGLLKSQGRLVLLGAPNKPLDLPVYPLLMGKFSSSLVWYFSLLKHSTILGIIENSVQKSKIQPAHIFAKNSEYRKLQRRVAIGTIGLLGICLALKSMCLMNY